MAKNFNIGDVVQLKVGGPEMVIREFVYIGGAIKVRCEWVVKGKALTGAFFATTLNRISAHKLR
jgi:uncharacterized protein YodC (DUF2158 family)